MARYDKNIRHLKEAVYAKLTGSSALTNLLGGNYIYHKSIPAKAKYPCVIYSVVSDEDNVFNEDQSTGEITRTLLRVAVFSRSKKTEESDNIESLIKSLLHGKQTLDTTKIICYSCYRDNLMEPMRDPDDQVWVTQTRYRATWAVKVIV